MLYLIYNTSCTKTKINHAAALIKEESLVSLHKKENTIASGKVSCPPTKNKTAVTGTENMASWSIIRNGPCRLFLLIKYWNGISLMENFNLLVYLCALWIPSAVFETKI